MRSLNIIKHQDIKIIVVLPIELFIIDMTRLVLLITAVFKGSVRIQLTEIIFIHILLKYQSYQRFDY